jgi:hypothetical protein
MPFAPNGSTPRTCLVCSFFSAPKPEWDESPHPTYCPRDGFKLTLLTCPSCNAPRMMHTAYSMFGGYHIAQHCTECGDAFPPLCPTEPQMRTKETPRAAAPHTENA